MFVAVLWRKLYLSINPIALKISVAEEMSSFAGWVRVLKDHTGTLGIQMAAIRSILSSLWRNRPACTTVMRLHYRY